MRVKAAGLEEFVEELERLGGQLRKDKFQKTFLD